MRLNCTIKTKQYETSFFNCNYMQKSIFDLKCTSYITIRIILNSLYCIFVCIYHKNLTVTFENQQ